MLHLACVLLAAMINYHTTAALIGYRGPTPRHRKGD